MDKKIKTEIALGIILAVVIIIGILLRPLSNMTSRGTDYSVFSVSPEEYQKFKSVEEKKKRDAQVQQTPVSAQNQRFDIAQFYAACGISCGQVSPCEGKSVTIVGYVDHSNIFDKTHYPNFPYQKFFLKENSKEAGRNIEIFVSNDTSAAESAAIFDEVYNSDSDRGSLVGVTGIVRGIDLPAAGTCLKGLDLYIDNHANIQPAGYPSPM